MVLDDSVLARSDALRELMRLARAIVQDGKVSDSEARGFQAWIEANHQVRGIPAVDDLLGLLTNVIHDGRLTDAERAELARTLEGFGG